MPTTFCSRAFLWALPLTAAVLCWWLLPTPTRARSSQELPRFTEEREAAALFFVKKHLPDLMPTLEKLKKAHPVDYQLEIREIFQVTELLADLRDDKQRYELELRIWVAENRAHLLIAKLSTPSEDERKKIQNELKDLAGHLVMLDLEVLEHKAELLDRELGDVKDEITRVRDNRDKQAKDRYEGLLQKVKKGKM